MSDGPRCLTGLAVSIVSPVLPTRAVLGDLVRIWVAEQMLCRIPLPVEMPPSRQRFGPCKFSGGLLRSAAALGLGGRTVGRAVLHPSNRLQERGWGESRAHAASLLRSCRIVILIEDPAPSWPLLSSWVPAIGHNTVLGAEGGVKYPSNQLSPFTTIPLFSSGSITLDKPTGLLTGRLRGVGVGVWIGVGVLEAFLEASCRGSLPKVLPAAPARSARLPPCSLLPPLLCRLFLPCYHHVLSERTKYPPVAFYF